MSDLERDIQRLWHEQPRAEHAMSIDDIRSKAERFERKGRRWRIVIAALVVALIVIDVWQVRREPALLERVGDLLTTAAIIYVLFRFHGYTTTRSMPAGLGLTRSLDFYRTELARQRDLASQPWRYLALFIPGVGLSLFGHVLDRSIAQNALVAALGVALFLAVAWVNSRAGRRRQREIDELDSIEVD